MVGGVQRDSLQISRRPEVREDVEPTAARKPTYLLRLRREDFFLSLDLDRPPTPPGTG
jgi:hypothetical protein